MADWTTLGAGLVGATAAIAGSLGGQVFRSRNETSREAKERHLRFRDMRRAAYAELLSATSRLISTADLEAFHEADEGLGELYEAFHRAAALAELYATPQSWVEMKGLLRIAQLKAAIADSPFGDQTPANLENMLRTFGADTAEGVDTWRERYVLAARADLSL